VQTIYEKAQDTRPEDKNVKLGGASTGAVVFKEISEKIMARKLRRDVAGIANDTPSPLPAIKNGNLSDADFVLSIMGIDAGDILAGGSMWGKISNNKQNRYSSTASKTAEGKIPDVVGMGAKDAVYLLQERNVGVKLRGYGKVKSQSLNPGRNIYPGDTIVLTLHP
jgi:cell division protein FtsI (penicillin-binding protein 3)